jgi:succinate dehydrogenase/fumarate reductase flavoprotein subunit
MPRVAEQYCCIHVFSFMQEYSPAVAELPTTNGDWAQGEGIQLGAGLGAALLHMEQVQVHPTGFVDPADPAAGTKVRCMDLQDY